MEEDEELPELRNSISHAFGSDDSSERSNEKIIYLVTNYIRDLVTLAVWQACGPVEQTESGTV